MQYHWLNKSKSRYYNVSVKKTSQDYLLMYNWGSCVTARGGKKLLSVKNLAEVDKVIAQLIKRRATRGYELIKCFQREG